jgi:NADH:ubiquinone oxidoreductase subunit 5 (subunit L)/multisubunit Na+/H+ antiporter MnhA subunit
MIFVQGNFDNYLLTFLYLYDIISRVTPTGGLVFYPVDTFAIFDHVTTTKAVSLVQVNTWLLSILAIFVTVILALFVYMNSRFGEAKTERDKLSDVLTQHTVALAKLETLVKLSITLKGYTLDQVDTLVEEETKKQETK